MNSVSFSHIDQVIEYFGAHMSGAYSRDNFDAFLTSIAFRFSIPGIHITGTNGKGSTATMLKNIYASSKRKVGLFTSPAFDRFSEMIYINDDEIDDLYVMEFMNRHVKGFDKYNLTTFEIQTFLAFSYFIDQKVDLAIIEVGMGGKLDATNVFTPLLSIITNIGLEHTNYLGPTITDVAMHKGGIIKPRRPVLVGRLEETPLKVIKAMASEVNAPLVIVNEPYSIKAGINQYFSYGPYKDLELTMNGSYQINNAALAVEACNILMKRFPLREKDIRIGLHKTFMPGRLEIFGSQPMIVIDGAHNPHGVAALVKSLSPFAKKTVFVIFASFKDKEIAPMIEGLETLSHHITLTSFPHSRVRHQLDYQDLKYPYIDDYKMALDRIYQNAPRSSVILITGSLAFAGTVRAYIQHGGWRR